MQCLPTKQTPLTIFLQYEKELLFGRMFCILSLIQGKKLVDDEPISKCVKELVKMADNKSYLEQIAYHGICELIEQVRLLI